MSGGAMAGNCKFSYITNSFSFFFAVINYSYYIHQSISLSSPWMAVHGHRRTASPTHPRIPRHHLHHYRLSTTKPVLQKLPHPCSHLVPILSGYLTISKSLNQKNDGGRNCALDQMGAKSGRGHRPHFFLF